MVLVPVICGMDLMVLLIALSPVHESVGVRLATVIFPPPSAEHENCFSTVKVTFVFSASLACHVKYAREQPIMVKIMVKTSKIVSIFLFFIYLTYHITMIPQKSIRMSTGFG